MLGGGQPIIVLNQNTKRECGRKVQLQNINAGKMIADVIRTCLGPRSMLKMLMDPMGGVVMTNDGNAILREITVQHPAAKHMIEIARTQDEEVGDGTSSVVILAGEMLAVAEQYLEQNMHPLVIIQAYRQALDDALEALRDTLSTPIDLNNEAHMTEVVQSCIGTKFLGQYGNLACKMALSAVRTVAVTDSATGRREIDVKKWARIEKIPGGTIEESCVLDGIMINKDVTHAKMKRRIENPRIVLLDCPLEYKKGESQTSVEMTAETDFTRLLQIEEEHVKELCADILALRPDLVITEKGVSDLAQHYLVKAGVTCLRRVKKSDNNRLARACGATICNRTEELKEEDVGTQAGLFEVKKIGDEYFSFITKCQDPKACTVLLRGPSKDILNEVERNLQDALGVARNLALEPCLVPGGGAVDMAVSHVLQQKAKQLSGVKQWPYQALAMALEVIPRTLAQNCGANIIRVLTALRAKHASGGTSFGVDGETGEVTDMAKIKIWEPLAVKEQVYKTAVETAVLLLRIDDIVSGSKKKDAGEGGAAPPPNMGGME
ncbi:T-complex protein 1 subunit gamma-like [Portunus trituberculatus]|uniref:T-complex protein 1 subunit gamma-like n=1 Tax=Portunus trituberculatus TaxID=210409 RepID=UPI001E1CD67D|nr:T-complex protein 1 subunit gamma-like [Portunus trituberculatus]